MKDIWHNDRIQTNFRVYLSQSDNRHMYISLCSQQSISFICDTIFWVVLQPFVSCLLHWNRQRLRTCPYSDYWRVNKTACGFRCGYEACNLDHGPCLLNLHSSVVSNYNVRPIFESDSSLIFTNATLAV